MQCTNPIWLERQQMHVPCGKCLSCRIAHSREWATRMLHEASMHDESTLFCTMTYSDLFLPAEGNLDKSEVQRAIKRLRKSIGEKKIRYFVAGEYGELNGRPHYHAVIFGLGYEYKKQIEDAWPFGFAQVTVAQNMYDVGRYVADYIFMKEKDKRLHAVAPFILMSKGIGKDFIIANRKQIEQDLTIKVRGVNVGLPRYYAQKLDVDKERMFARAREKAMSIGKEWLERQGYEQTRSQLDAETNQRAWNTYGRKNLRKKGRDYYAYEIVRSEGQGSSDIGSSNGSP